MVFNIFYMLDCYLKSLCRVMITALSHGRKSYNLVRILKKNLHNPKLSHFIIGGGENTDSPKFLRGGAAGCTLWKMDHYITVTESFIHTSLNCLWSSCLIVCCFTHKVLSQINWLTGATVSNASKSWVWPTLVSHLQDTLWLCASWVKWVLKIE